MAYPGEAGQDAKMGARGDGETVERQAADWAARLDRGPLSPDEQHELEAWAGADVRHQGALARALAMLALFDRPDGPDAPIG